MNRICLVICWFGKLPEYFPVWAKSCEFNSRFDFLLITDHTPSIELPINIKIIPFDKKALVKRIRERLVKTPSIEKAYRLCDFRPMYGVIFREELKQYDYWGYCDVDVVFGNIEHFLTIEDIMKYEAVFNNGHFTLIKNTDNMNHLFSKKGALFNYKTVMKNNATFAFDETTGIQRIARKNNVNALYGIEYVEADSKYKQLRSRMEESNPDIQGFYWENGSLYRVKAEDESIYFREIAYIHLQKREIVIKNPKVIESNSFWITPNGYDLKNYLGFPNKQDILKFNTFEGRENLYVQEKMYKKNKLKEIIKRNPYQIYVRIKQGLFGINAQDGNRRDIPWEKC